MDKIIENLANGLVDFIKDEDKETRQLTLGTIAGLITVVAISVSGAGSGCKELASSTCELISGS